MTKRTFSTFADASTFARRQAQKLGAAVRVEREGSEWTVFSMQPSRSSSSVEDALYLAGQEDSAVHNWSGWSHEEELKQKKEKKRLELERMAREVEIREREKRRPYLEERKRHYQSLTGAELDSLWNCRDELDLELELDEEALLRDVVREAKGIKPAMKTNAKACRCGMVGENCTCGRSWF